MCNPAAIMIMTAAGTGIQAYGQYQQGQYQEQVGKNNAIISRQLAKDALSRGEAAETAHRMKVAQLKSQQAAKMSAAGLDISSGSAARILEDTAEMGELDALMIRQNAQREAFEKRVDSSNFQAQSELSKMAGNYGAASTILTGAGKVGKQWYQGNG